MPRIKDEIVLNDIHYKPVRPQDNGNAAQYRAEIADTPLALLPIASIFATQETKNRITYLRGRGSLVVPRVAADGTPLVADRFDFSTRVGSVTTNADIDALIASARAFVNSQEFADSVRAEAQF